MSIIRDIIEHERTDTKTFVSLTDIAETDFYIPEGEVIKATIGGQPVEFSVDRAEDRAFHLVSYITAAAESLAITVKTDTKVFRKIKSFLKDESQVLIADREACIYDPVDNKLWVTDDGRNKIHDVDVDTGLTTQEVLFPAANVDMEAIEIDGDVMYVASGTCCPAGTNEARIFKLTRDVPTNVWTADGGKTTEQNQMTSLTMIGGVLHITNDNGRNLRTYDYDTHTYGPVLFAFPQEVYDSHLDGNILWVTMVDKKLHKYDATVLTNLIEIENHNLTFYNMHDCRAITKVGKQFVLIEGYDYVDAVVRHPVNFYNIEGE